MNGLGGNLGTFDGNSEFEAAIDDGALVYYRRDPSTGARTPMTGSGAKIKFPFLFDNSLRAMGSGIRDVMFGQYPFVNPCDVNAGPTPTPTATPTPTPPAPQADLAATADAQPYQVEPGGTLVFNNAVTNNGPSLANSVTVDVYVPPYTQLDGYSAPGGTCQTTTYPNDAGHQVLCSFGDLSPSETRTVTVNVTITAIDGASMQAINTVSSSTADPDSNNNVAYAPLIVRAAGPPPVAIGKVAFQTNRDGNTEIYVMEADGSNPINVSNSAAEDYQPVWSPDGSKIAFQSQRDGNPELYVVNPDGSNLVRLTNDGGEDSNPSWSPDGSKITFASSRATGGMEVFVMNADGSNPTRLTFGSDNSNSSDLPKWSPDGTRIAYQHQIYTESGGNATAQYEIYVMNADGSNQVNLTNSAENENAQSWSPDSASLIFSQNEELFVIPSIGGTPLNITNGPGSIDRLPHWAPNGERIVFVSDRYGTNEILSVAPDGSGLLRLTDNSGQVFDRWDYLPAYTTTGSAIAFTRFGDGQTEFGNTEIYLMNTDGSSQTNLTNNPAEDSDFAWQPIPPTPPIADVYIGAYAAGLYVPNGGQVTYNIVVGSFGPYPVSNITLTGQFPAGVTFVSADTASGSCTGTPGDSTFNCTITDTLSSYESRQVTVMATATGVPYTPINTTFEATSAYDNNSTNNSAVAQFYIASPPLPGPTPGPVNEAQLAYGQFDSNVGQWDIFVQRADAAGLVNLTDSPTTEDKYAWSPDGSRLGFLRFDFANTTVSLCTVNADGSNLAVLTNVPNEYIDSFAWSPNGNRLTFNGRSYSGEGPQTSEIFVINADGTGRASVSGPVGYNNEPEWSPAGTRISYLRYFFDPDAPTSDIYVSNPDGT